MSKYYEIFEDGVFLKRTDTYDAMQDFKEKLTHKLSKEGYVTIKSCMEYDVLFNEKLFKSICICTREYIGFNDCNGRPIYYGDELVDKDGQAVGIFDIDDCGNPTERHLTRWNKWGRIKIPIESQKTLDKEGIRVKFSMFRNLKNH